MAFRKLTPANQLQRFYEDVERLNNGGRADFSIGQHLELLIKRMDAAEAKDITQSLSTPPNKDTDQ